MEQGFGVPRRIARLLQHPGWGLRKKRIKLWYASYNVRTMTGRSRELADLLKIKQINVTCLQKTKWKGTKPREIGEKYEFYYFGSDGKRNGVGVVLYGNLKESVIDIKRINYTLAVVKVIVQNIMLKVMITYAPQRSLKKRKIMNGF